MPLFDSYIVVDWSAENRPKIGKDSIWICCRDADGRRTFNPRTRQAAKDVLAGLIGASLGAGRRVLIGFDFPFGYPAGFAARLGLTGTPWRAVWDELGGLVRDDANNCSNRFTVGAELNRRISGGAFPFWGCPKGLADEFLRTQKLDRHSAEGLAEKRLIDAYMRGAQPCWKLAYPGSVGSQALTGIPVVRELRDDLRWRDRAQIWPFETGLRAPNETRIVFAEVWPSWWKARAELGPPNDKAQVRTVAEIFAKQDRSGELAAVFGGDPQLTAAQRRIVESEEAWTLGVTAPKHAGRRKSPISLLKSGRNPGSSPPFLQDSQAIVPLDRRSARAADRSAPAVSRVRETVGGLCNMPDAAERIKAPRYTYLRDPGEIYRRSFAAIRAEASLDRFPREIEPLALRLAHAAGDTAILADLAWSPDAVAAGKKALAAGAPILVDGDMVAAGIARERLPAGNLVRCRLREPEIADLSARLGTTRAAAAVEMWREHLLGSIIAIGNAPTALFHLLELLEEGAEMPALVLGFPVGFVGAAEAKRALTGFGRGLEFITLHGRRGGSALAAAAVNALAGAE